MTTHEIQVILYLADRDNLTGNFREAERRGNVALTPLHLPTDRISHSLLNTSTEFYQHAVSVQRLQRARFVLSFPSLHSAKRDDQAIEGKDLIKTYFPEKK